MRNQILFSGWLILCFHACAFCMTSDKPIKITEMNDHTSVYVFKTEAGQYGIGVNNNGLASVDQGDPIEIEIYSSDTDIKKVRSGYDKITKNDHGFRAHAAIRISDSTSLWVEDKWSVKKKVLSLQRTVTVKGNDTKAFMSGVTLATEDSVSRSEVDYFVPGMMYGSCENLNRLGIGGCNTFKSEKGYVWIREDRTPAPMFGVRFRDGSSITVLHPDPDGRTTLQDSQDLESVTLIDERFGFGAVGTEYADGKLVCGFRFPGTEGEVTYKGNTYPDGQIKKWRRRYHPLKDGFVQKYCVQFRFANDATFPEFSTNAWRWAWQTLDPTLHPQDIETARYHLVKMLTGEVEEVGDRAGITNFTISTPSVPPWRFPTAIMGFTGKNLETAYFLLKSSYEEDAPDAAKQRELGRKIVDSFTKLKMDPPEAEGFHIKSGEPALALPHGQDHEAVYLRSLGDGMKAAARAYLLEKAKGTDHSNWLKWLVGFGDWLLEKQTPEGSFPRKFTPVTGTIRDSAPQTTYNAIPFLIHLSEATGEDKYFKAALKAAEFSWSNGQDQGVFVGGTIDNPNVIDKEAGTLSLEVYVMLYERTKDAKWLQRATKAANFAETWIYLWDVPMIEEEDNAKLHWKKGVSTIGLQLISTGHTLVDAYMAYDADEYAKLYKWTGDPHYFDVAGILLHNTKSMMALPDHPYDLHALGWSQEHWSLAPLRGYGLHRGWLPWVTCSHLNGIYGIRDFDPQLYERIVSTSQKQK